MLRDYCARLKERSSGMGALKNDDIIYDYISRSNPNLFQPRAPKQMEQQHAQQFLFPGYLCPPADENENDSPEQTQIIWSPLFDGNDIKSSDEMKATAALMLDKELPVGWRTAEQKILEMNGRTDTGTAVSSCSSNSNDEQRTSVWTSAQCLLHMKDIVEPANEIEEGTDQERPVADSFLEYSSCDLQVCSLDGNGKPCVVDDYEGKVVKNCHTEASVEESKYHSCSGGDGSVCSSGIGRGKLNKRESYTEDDLLSEINVADSSSESLCRDKKVPCRGGNKELKNASATRKTTSPEKPTGNVRQTKSNDRKTRRTPQVAPGLKDGKSTDFNVNSRIPRTWNHAGSRAPVQRMRRKEDAPKDTEKPSRDGQRSNHDRKHHWCLHNKRGQAFLSEEATSTGSTTVDEEPRLQRGSLTDQNAELISTLAEMNTRELKSLQCSSAIMRHNLGILRDDVKKLQGCLDVRNTGYSWWSLLKNVVVAAGLVSGAFGLRTVIDMLKKTVRYGGSLSRLTNKQEKMALAAFVLTVGARFGKQIWREQGNASCHREMKLREHLSRIDERVSLMSGLTTGGDSTNTSRSLSSV